ncbi:MAG: hypothetical protein Q7R49_04570 [Candidatus Daviesbacteria bacterium]|nr:hypothetical protein [Candidatus Daviesbacteria bacterium]
MKIRPDITKIIILFLGWRLFLVIVMFIAINFLPLGYKDRFLGGGSANYSIATNLFSWANFDGEHYLSISIIGYKGLEQAFFPVYPFLMSIISKPFISDFVSSLVYATLSGLLISNFCFLLSLIVLHDLLKIDYSKKIVMLTIFLLVIFPTSFFFGAVYGEAVFLLLSVTSFYFARQGRWLLAGIFGMVASATRIFGILLLPAYLLEARQQHSKIKNWWWIFFIPLGVFGYMFYQWQTAGDPLAFYHLQKLVGEQHQSGLTLLPQVYFRYIKMIITVNPQNPIFQTTILELVTGILFFILPIYGYFKKIRWSYIFFALVGFLLPTIQGSFSSVPRYILVLFPSFLALAIFLDKTPKLVRAIFIGVSIVLLGIETALFLRAYWVA